MLRGPNVTLRPTSESDEGVLYELATDDASWEERNDTPPAPLSRAAYAERFRARLLGNDVQFVIEVGGSVVGRCDLFALDLYARHAEVGIALIPTARGKGYGTEALRLLVRFAFERRNLRRLHLRTLASNPAALASYTKVGFVREGVLRESAWVRGGYVDEILMGVLRSEWAG